MTNLELATYLARGLFEIGNEPHDKVQRIQFMGGDWRAGKETVLGGLCEEALVNSLRLLLDRLPEQHKPESP